MEKKEYTAPELTTISFRNERGYAFSSLTETAERIDQEITMMLALENGDGSQSMESFDYQSGWGESDGDGFWTTGSNGSYF